MVSEEGVPIGLGGGASQVLRFGRANRHGLIAGATGTGKTTLGLPGGLFRGR